MASYVIVKTAKVFSNGRSRAVRIPKDWLGGADSVSLRREGGCVVIEPLRPTLGEIAERFRKRPVSLERVRQAVTPPKSLDS